MSFPSAFDFAVVSAFFVACSAAGLLIGWGLERWWKKPVWSVPLDAGQLRHEAIGNAIFLVVTIPAVALVWRSGWVRFGDDGAARAAATFAAYFFAFQVWFYVMHRALHTKALVRFHRWHHLSRVTTPLSGQSVGVVEAIGWAFGYAGLPLLMSLVAPISEAGVIAYLVFNVVGNIMGHANVEIIAPSKTLWLRSLTATVFTYHALHHARWTGHFGYASTWMDRLLKTEWADWPELHKKVWSGAPMTSLKEKAPIAPSSVDTLANAP